jgi:hypothetical protein
MAIDSVGPGDVLAVLSNNSFWSWIVRTGEWIQRKPSLVNHVVIVTHRDQLGRWIGISGQPGGVVLCDVTPYLVDDRTRSNHQQPRPGDAAMATFLASCAKSLGIAYDWVGIGEDAFNMLDLHDLSGEIDHLWRWPSDANLLPAHVVCSSLASWLYTQVGWAEPTGQGPDRTCDPADWWDWNDKALWTKG